MTKSHYGNFWNHQKNHAMENHTMEIHVSEGIAVPGGYLEPDQN